MRTTLVRMLIILIFGTAGNAVGVYMYRLYAQPGALGPTVIWEYPGPAESLGHFEICVDTTPCLDVGASPNKDKEGPGTYSWRLAAALTPQSHTFIVKTCNGAGCVESAPFTVGLPAQAKIVRVK